MDLVKHRSEVLPYRPQNAGDHHHYDECSHDGDEDSPPWNGPSLCRRLKYFCWDDTHCGLEKIKKEKEKEKREVKHWERKWGEEVGRGSGERKWGEEVGRGSGERKWGEEVGRGSGERKL